MKVESVDAVEAYAPRPAGAHDGLQLVEMRLQLNKDPPGRKPPRRARRRN